MYNRQSKLVFAVITAVFVLFGSSVFLSAAPAVQNGGNQAKDAQQLVAKAIDYIKANGKEKAYAEFTRNDTGQFKKGDLYVFVLTNDYRIAAHGANPKLMGKDLKELKDSNGKYFFKEMVDSGLKNGESWTDYMWTNPLTGKPAPKSSYVKKFDDKSVVGCGIYKK